MKFHPIFSKQYISWWIILVVTIFFKITIFGFNENGLSKLEGYEDKGVLFWIIGVLFTAIIFSTPFYLISKLILKKWNHKVFMVLISILVGLLLIFSL